MLHPPTGAVTFLFTDIEGSTARWEHQREAMSAALVRHDALVRSAIETRGGHVFKTVGDAFCAAFTHADDALAAALDAQHALAAEDWRAFGPELVDLPVRMGIHHGRAETRGGDYFGPALNRTARLMAAGHGGQVLLSLAAHEVVRDYLPPEATLRDWGEHRLKDLRYSEHIFQVVAPDLPDVDAAPATAERLSAQDRIVIDPEAAARTLPEALAELLAAVRGEDRTVALTPEQARWVATHQPREVTEYRLGRIAEWSLPRYRLDGRFVELTLLVDQGEESASGRWAAREERHASLSELLVAVPEPAIVVLGPPGSGKSTLLRHLELETAMTALQSDAPADGGMVTFFVPLNTFRSRRSGERQPLPEEWLAALWSERYPSLPGLESLVASGRMVFLLDALNEMPAPSEAAFRDTVGHWKDWLQRLAKTAPGNRVVFSCRTLDYSQPLSTPALRVPQVRIEPLADAQVRAFLALYSPYQAEDLWARLDGTPQLEVVRSPYFLKLLVDQAEATGQLPAGRAGLFTGFVRQALRREVERDNPLFAPDTLLTSRDVRKVTHEAWAGPYELPERGALVPKLEALAYGMQAAAADGGASQVRVAFDAALALIGHERDEDIVRAGVALSVLDEDPASDEVLYVHQLVQEYFAARELAEEPARVPELVRVEWRAAQVRPTIDEVIDGLDAADPLPGLAGTGWEETALLAAAMAADPAAFVRAVGGANLALAGRCAVQPEVRERLPAELADELRWALVRRSRDPEADLRDRIACGYAVGDLGDPRFERREGPHGPYLTGPLVEIPSGVYPIGDDEPIEWALPGASGTTTAHVPRHEVAVGAFRIGQFPVTNAEWTCFMAAGGYEDERWWGTQDARRWRRGELANEGARSNNRVWRKRFQADPALFETIVEEGRFPSEEAVERWRGWMAMDEAAFKAALDQQWQAKRETEPRFWRDERYNGPAQPVVGVCWYEGRAYCAWLSEQMAQTVRLPMEVEWEAAARGGEAGRFPWGEAFDRLNANTYETRVKRTTPVGVFPSGDGVAGAADMSGNVFEWTSSLFGEGEEDEEPVFGYPYDGTDGREDATAPPAVRRVVRGGGWYNLQGYARAAFRDYDYPDDGGHDHGLRVVVSASSPIPVALGPGAPR